MLIKSDEDVATTIEEANGPHDVEDEMENAYDASRVEEVVVNKRRSILRNRKLNNGFPSASTSSSKDDLYVRQQENVQSGTRFSARLKLNRTASIAATTPTSPITRANLRRVTFLT